MLYFCLEKDEELVNVEGEQALSTSTIRRWIATFKDGEEEIKDKARSGRPREAVTSEKIARVEDLVSNDPHTSIKELTNEVGISRERISYILHEELNLHKLCAKWVPHRLSEEHKRNRVELSKQLLKILDGGYKNIITGDETWIYFFTISNKEANKSWIEKGGEQAANSEDGPKFEKNVLHIFCGSKRTNS